MTISDVQRVIVAIREAADGLARQPYQTSDEELTRQVVLQAAAWMNRDVGFAQRVCDAVNKRADDGHECERGPHTV